jgi:hypothetical protein
MLKNESVYPFFAGEKKVQYQGGSSRGYYAQHT